MMSKIIAVIALFAAKCTGDATNYHEPHSPVKHAVSSQSFVRHDVPLSYKHTAVHIYTTEKPQNYVQRPVTPTYQASRSNHQPQEIQYAPILREQKAQYPNGVHNIVEHDPGAPTEKSNLEPKPNNHPELSFVPGYNIEILQSVNKYPGHNAVYRSYPNMRPQEKINKQHHLKQFVLYDRKQEHLLPEVVETTQAAPTFDFVPKQYKADSNLYNTAPVITDLNSLVTPQLAAMNIQLQGYPPHPMDHKLHLNIARAYSIAKLSAKAQNEMARLKKNSLDKTQTLYQLANAKPNNEHKTRLFPVMYKTISQYS